MSHFNSKKAMRRKYSIKLHLMVNFKDKEHFFKYRKKKAYKKITLQVLLVERGKQK